MATKSLTTGEGNGSKPKFSTFAVLDLETTGLPQFNSNRVGITELCIFAFDSNILRENVPLPPLLPTTPRALHKLNLLFRPEILIDPYAEKISGLSNSVLDRESQLDENAAQMIMKFLEHLPAPVCLVAHYGLGFDYPILKQAFDKLKVQLPDSVFCVDSICIFREIDEKRGCLEPKPYKLSLMYERIFQQPVVNAHQSEGDVNMITKLMQHYGVDFLTVAEERAIPFSKVAHLRYK